jgi:hypothetical protein
VVGILEEARFFGIQEMVEKFQHHAECSSGASVDPPLTRQDVIKAIIQTPHHSELRFQVKTIQISDFLQADSIFYCCF